MLACPVLGIHSHTGSIAEHHACHAAVITRLGHWLAGSIASSDAAIAQRNTFLSTQDCGVLAQPIAWSRCCYTFSITILEHVTLLWYTDTPIHTQLPPLQAGVVTRHAGTLTSTATLQELVIICRVHTKVSTQECT
jgi:hypothetical protein